MKDQHQGKENMWQHSKEGLIIRFFEQPKIQQQQWTKDFKGRKIIYHILMFVVKNGKIEMLKSWNSKYHEKFQCNSKSSHCSIKTM